jgi:hypothetical protein
LIIEDVGLVAVALGPPQVHAHEHLRPVFGVGATCAGVNAQDRIRAIGRAAEHALDLGLPHARLDLRHLRRGVGEHAVVVLGGAELEVLLEVGQLFGELRDELELRLGLRSLSQRLLGGFVVVPEPRAERPVIQIFEETLESRDVKDAPLAHHGAF